jgi:hypothetical protein
MLQRLARRAAIQFPRAGHATFEPLESRRLRTATPQEVLFADVGVGGSDLFHVSPPLYVSVAPFGNSADIDNPDDYQDVYDQTFGPIRTQIALNDADELLGPLDVFGMPVMQGKIVVMDGRPLNAEDPLDLGTMKTYVYSPGTPFNPDDDEENPGIPQTNQHVDLSYGSFDRFTEVTPAGAPGPTLLHNPFIGPNPVRSIDPSLPPDNTPGITIGQGGRTFTGSFLLDTGAVASMISQHSAESVGVTYAEGTYGTDSPRLVDSAGRDVPNQFSLTIGGIGGATKVAGFFLDTMTLPTLEGQPIRYVRAPVLVSDITVADPDTGQELTLDGIFGMNSLVASAFIDENDPFPFPTDITSGPYDWITFDEPNGVLGLNVPDYVPSPGPVDIEGVQPVALDQPRINALLRWTADGEPLVASDSGFESFNIQAFLDTGASGVLLSKETAEGLGVPNSTFATPEGVVGRHVFYNNSSYDGASALAHADDDGAVATDKTALLPGGAATFDNVSTFLGGINGVMVDIADLPAGRDPVAADFTLRTGTSVTPSTWSAGPVPTSVTVRRGAGEAGSDRVTLTFANGAIKNTWLQVTVNAGADTGLAAPDVFYFGSLIGDTGDGAAGADPHVNALDVAGVKRALNGTSGVTGRFDFNRDGRVNALDVAAVKQNLTRTLTLVTAPSTAGAARAAGAPAATLLLALPTSSAWLGTGGEGSGVTSLLRRQE